MQKLDVEKAIDNMDKFAIKLRDLSKKYVRLKTKGTGDLESAITKTKAKMVNGNIEVEVFVDKTQLYTKRRTKPEYQDKKYPIYVAKGTKPHTIRPRPNNKRGVLSFNLKTGQRVFAKEVYHPGTKPIKYFEIPFKTLQKKNKLYPGITSESK